MDTVSKFVKVHPDVLVEWVYDSTCLRDSDYTVVVDGLNNTRAFAHHFGLDVVAADKDPNRADRQLFQLDSVANRWGVVDTAARPYLQREDHVAPAFSRFDRVRLYFPINYNFAAHIGFYVGVHAYDADNRRTYALANYFLDYTNATHREDIKLVSPPWQFQERLWGKVVEFLVPAVYDQARAVGGSPLKPLHGSINYNLTAGGAGLSPTSPVLVDFRFLERRELALGMPTYTLTPSRVSSVPQAPEYQTLGVAVQPADDGDYFEIYGTFNNNTADFDDFMDALQAAGQRCTLTFAVTVFEENMAQNTVTFALGGDFNRRIPFCPVLKYTNTTASIQVTMTILDEGSGSSEVRTAEIGLLQHDVAKFGRLKTRINVEGAMKPKVYVARPEQVIQGSAQGSAQSRRVRVQRETVVKLKPYPVMTEAKHVVVGDVTRTLGGTTYHGQGDLELVFHPFDNVVKLHVSVAQGNTRQPLDTTGATLQLSFKTGAQQLDVQPLTESPEHDPENGVHVFRVTSHQVQQLQQMRRTSDAFYLTARAQGAATVAYHGTYAVSGSTALTPKQAAIKAEQKPLDASVKDLIKVAEQPAPKEQQQQPQQQPSAEQTPNSSGGGSDMPGNYYKYVN